LQVVISVTPQHADALAAKGEQPPKPLLGHALIDTGASITAVDEDVCRKLGLFSTGVVKMKHAGGADSRMCYPVQISFPGTPLPQFSNPRAVSCALGGPHILLFGRDLLASLRFVYNGPAGRIEVAF
jgi:predicted aspartyl protease